MLGSILVTVGLFLDIVGVALLLAGPRVHPRGSFLKLGGGEEELTPIRRLWSKYGKFGLPTVASGFALQMLGAWSEHMDAGWLAVAGGIAIPAVFAICYWLIQRLPAANSGPG